MADPAPPDPAAERYLEGIRVLDFTQYLAGPSCTRLLAEMGAEVIKVEMAPHGDPTRATQPRRNRRSAFFVQQTRGKKSLCVDLQRPEGIELVKELVPHVDIVVENYSPGVMARRGMGWDDLSALNPRLIMASVSGFGQSGPLQSKTAYDFIAMAYSGILHMTGEPDGPPMMVGVGVADTATGVHAFAAIGYALFRRDRTGKGAHLDVAMVDAMYHMQEMGVSSPSMTGGEWEARRNGVHYAPASPAGCFQGPEGHVVLMCAQNQIAGLWRAMDRPDLAADPRFTTDPERREHRDELTEIIEAWMAGFDTDAEVLAALDAERVPCGPVINPVDLIDAHPHFAERGTVRQITDRLAGDMLIPGFPIRFSDAPADADLQCPDLGQHNHEILTGLLGYDDAAIATLERDEVLSSKNR